MPTTRSSVSTVRAPPVSSAATRRIRSSTSRSAKRRKGPKPRKHAVHSESPNPAGDSEEHMTGGASNSREQPTSASTHLQNPGPQESDVEEDFGLQQLMGAANLNDGAADAPNQAATDNRTAADPPQLDGRNEANASTRGGCRGSNDLGNIQPLTKVTRPFGAAGRHFNLQKEMGLQSDRKLYNQIQRETRWAMNQANLPLIPFKRQDHQAIFAITQAMKERFPFLGRFVRPAVWPVIEMIKLLLRNRRAYHKAMGIPPPGNINNDVEMEIDQ